MLSLIMAAILAATPTSDICKCGVSCDCADSVVVITERPASRSTKICAITERSPARTQTVRKTETRQTAVAYRSPIGDHTHTCMNDDCKFYKTYGVRLTSDHKSNKTHNCAVCGAYQNVQDDRKRLVVVLGAQSVPQAAPRASQALAWPVSYSNCPNGNCPYVR